MNISLTPKQLERFDQKLIRVVIVGCGLGRKATGKEGSVLKRWFARLIA